MKLEFDVVDKHGNRTSYLLGKGFYKLGKGDDCDVILNDTLVSRNHGQLKVESLACFLGDIGSTNGIWHNGVRIKEPTLLEVGSAFNMGELQLEVKNVEHDDAMSLLLQSEQREGSVSQQGDSAELIALKKSIHGLILDYLDLRKRANLQAMSPAELRLEAEKATKEIVEEKIKKVPAEITKELLIEQVVAEAVGLGALEPLLKDDQITEIMVNGPRKIYVERNGKITLSNSQFTSDQALMGVIDRIVAPLGRRIDESSPMVDARLPDGSRVNAIIPPLSLMGPTITIRKFTKKKLSVKDLINFKTCTVQMALFLKTCVMSHRNIVVSGGTGSGKTTTLNILSNFIAADERIVTIEDAAELALNQPHVISLESRPANAEGKGKISIRDLVINSLRMRPDRIIVGECRSGEALDMLQAMNTGHDGSLTTGHANTAKDFLARLEVMVLMAGVELPSRAIREQISSAVHIIIQQSRLGDGTRRITSIEEVLGMEGDSIVLEPIFEYRKTGIDSDGKIIGEFLPTGYIPKFYRDLKEAGVNLDWSIFEKPSQQSVDSRNDWN